MSIIRLPEFDPTFPALTEGVRAKMEFLGLNQTQLAVRLGVSKSTVCRLLKAGHMSLDTFVRCCLWLDVQVCDVLTDPTLGGG